MMKSLLLISTPVLSGILIILFASAPAYTATVTIKYNAVLDTLAQYYHGVNLVGRYDWFSCSGSQGSREALRRAGVEIIRFPGGVSGDAYNWRTPTAISGMPFKTVYAYAESIGAKVMFQTNAHNSTSLAAQWLDTCLKLGYDVPFWEVGNEPEWWSTPPTSQYSAIFHSQATALHEKSRNVKVIGAATANMYINKNLLQTYPNDPDGLSFHWYGGGGWANMKGAAQIEWPLIMSYLNTFNSKNIPFYVTEWSPLGPTGGDVANDFNKTIGAALCYMDMIGTFTRSGVDGYTMFGCIHGVDGNWGILSSSVDYKPQDQPGPSYFVFPLWTKMGRIVLDLDNSENDTTAMSAYACKKPDGSVQVLLINKSAERSVTVGFQGFDPANARVSIHEFRPVTAGDVADWHIVYNNVTNPLPATQDLPGPDIQTCAGASFTRQLPAYSATMLDLNRNAASRGPVRIDEMNSGLVIRQTGDMLHISVTGVKISRIQSIKILGLDGKVLCRISSQPNQKNFKCRISARSARSYVIAAETGGGTLLTQLYLQQ